MPPFHKSEDAYVFAAVTSSPAFFGFLPVRLEGVVSVIFIYFLQTSVKIFILYLRRVALLTRCDCVTLLAAASAIRLHLRGELIVKPVSDEAFVS